MNGPATPTSRRSAPNANSPAADRQVDSAADVLLSVVAPCYNEQENIDPLVTRTLAVFDTLGVGAELILVDDGSADRTWFRIADWALCDARVRGYRHESNAGIVAAWRSGLSAAQGSLVCLIDADLQNRPEDIPRLLERYRAGGADIVQGVRHSVGTGERLLLFTRGLNLLLNAAFGSKLRDGKSGFIVCPRDVLSHLLGHRFRYSYYQSFIGAAAVVRGYVIAEVDTPFDPRTRGVSFLPQLPIRATLRILWELVKFRFETWWWKKASSETESLRDGEAVHTRTRRLSATGASPVGS